MSFERRLNDVCPLRGLCVVCRQRQQPANRDPDFLTFSFWRLRGPGVRGFRIFCRFVGGSGVRGSGDSGFFDFFWRLLGPGVRGYRIFDFFFGGAQISLGSDFSGTQQISLGFQWYTTNPGFHWYATNVIRILVVR